jgi:hypothetical protein
MIPERKEPIVSDPDRYDPGRPPVAPCPHIRVIRIEADPVYHECERCRRTFGPITPSLFAIIQDYLASMATRCALPLAAVPTPDSLHQLVTRILEYLDAQQQVIEGMNTAHADALAQLASCHAIAEGAPGWESDVTNGPAVQAVIRLRKALDAPMPPDPEYRIFTCRWDSVIRQYRFRIDERDQALAAFARVLASLGVYVADESVRVTVSPDVGCSRCP